MVLTHKEKVKSNFKGTIIDIETIGDFDNRFDDSRRYKQHTPIIFGFINNSGLSVYCAKKIKTIEILKEKTVSILDKLRKPFYAFNSEFERGVLFHNLNKKVIFERELNKEKYEPKWFVVHSLKIPQYNDPFRDRGILCTNAWLKGQIKKAVAHNRSCLLKERDILLKRGFRKPDKLKFIED